MVWLWVLQGLLLKYRTEFPLEKVWMAIRKGKSTLTSSRRSCLFRKLSLSFLRHFRPVIESVSIKEKEKSNVGSNLDLAPGPFVSFSLTTSLPPDPPKFLKVKVHKQTNKLFFLTDTSITGDPSPFHNYQREFNSGFNVVLSKSIEKRIIFLIVT